MLFRTDGVKRQAIDKQETQLRSGKIRKLRDFHTNILASREVITALLSVVVSN